MKIKKRGPFLVGEYCLGEETKQYPYFEDIIKEYVELAKDCVDAVHGGDFMELSPCGQEMVPDSIDTTGKEVTLNFWTKNLGTKGQKLKHWEVSSNGSFKQLEEEYPEFN
jgi:hypothetical protein